MRHQQVADDLLRQSDAIQREIDYLRRLQVTTNADRRPQPRPRPTTEDGNLIDLDAAVPTFAPSTTHHPLPPIPPPARPLPPLPVRMVNPNVPQPGPAVLSKNFDLYEMLGQALQCKHLPEHAMKHLCERVKECLMEGKSCATSSAYLLHSFSY